MSPAGRLGPVAGGIHIVDVQRRRHAGEKLSYRTERADALAERIAASLRRGEVMKRRSEEKGGRRRSEGAGCWGSRAALRPSKPQAPRPSQPLQVSPEYKGIHQPLLTPYSLLPTPIRVFANRDPVPTHDAVCSIMFPQTNSDSLWPVGVLRARFKIMS